MKDAKPAEKVEGLEDYVLKENSLALVGHFCPFPLGQDLFEGKAASNYERFRHSWVLVPCVQPLIPCPEQCPLPGKKMSKE